jgi:hypothetical protein
VNLKKLLEIEQKSGIATDIFALGGYLFICLGNIIQRFQITREDNLQFQERSEYSISTDKVKAMIISIIL